MFDPSVPQDLVYSGNVKLTDPVEGAPLDAGQLGALAHPHLRAPIIKKVLEAYGPGRSTAWCTARAARKILHFIESGHVVKDNLFPIPPLFQLIHEQSGTDWKEMYQVFNCGHRMELYVPETIAQELIAISDRSAYRP